ncbi:hypothetical protein [Algoriphagus hitonicola]|uniref:Uncharacterized protein n=1 Tax=Algoriphagus hitonicola TaxID=435880 RepID=A0A1I2VLZ1_9BACT|nr:hypothetical protein [Algoriphagus hitonicola]SFG90345.1 hypothetical protein SAMN04487988_11029 [Algoriphagus hitonicola]
MPRAVLHIAFVLLILLNGMGYSLIQLHFYWDREEITALYCINKDKPELQCDGQCELGKRLAETKNQRNEQGEEITLEELQLTFLVQDFTKINLSSPDFIGQKQSFLHPTELISSLHLDVFHPPQSS